MFRAFRRHCFNTMIDDDLMDDHLIPNHKLIMSFLNLLLAIKYMLRQRVMQKFKLLVKPHKFICLLHGYRYFYNLVWCAEFNLGQKKDLLGKYIAKGNFLCRATTVNSDVWVNLSTNWDHCFWLTGEFPDTLQIIVNKIERRFFIRNHRGPRTMLSVRNQVLLSILLEHQWSRFICIPDHASLSRVAAWKFVNKRIMVQILNFLQVLSSH